MNLINTLDSGQIFRYKEYRKYIDDNGNKKYIIQSMDRVVLVEYLKERASIQITPIGNHNRDYLEELKYWYRFLCLDNSIQTEVYERICHQISEFDRDILGKAFSEVGPIMIIRQDPWECLISFIISQNNNIPRIKTCIDRLCRLCGHRIPDIDPEIFSEDFYSFPTPEEILEKSVEDLKSIGLGYRAEYIINAARALASNKLSLESLLKSNANSYQLAKDTLMKLKGVGDKVADCVCLFSLGYTEACPRDVWIKRFEKKHNMDISVAYKPLAGLVQQHVYKYILNHKDEYRDII